MEATLSETSKLRRNWKAVARERAASGLAKRQRGGQPNNDNRLLHGRFSRRMLSRRAEVQALIRDAAAVAAELNRAAKLLKNSPATRFEYTQSDVMSPDAEGLAVRMHDST
jgi:hypothetical protein